MESVWLFFLVIITIILAAIAFHLGQKEKKTNRILRQYKEKYQEIYDEVCKAEDRTAFIIEKGNKYIDLYNDVLKTVCFFDKNLFFKRVKLSDIFPNNFVFNKPRQEISGDFYWIEKVHSKSFLILGDCSGFDITGYLFKKATIEIIKEVIKNESNLDKNAAQYLDEIKLQFSILYSKESIEPRFSLYLSLCLIDYEKGLINFAGASSSIIFISNSSMIEYKGDRNPIGLHSINNKYTNHKINIEEDNCIYLYSDGYHDQFGGELNRKFMFKNFKELLSEIHLEDMETQKKNISAKFEKWQGNNEQTDDILIIGIKFEF